MCTQEPKWVAKNCFSTILTWGELEMQTNSRVLCVTQRDRALRSWQARQIKTSYWFNKISMRAVPDLWARFWLQESYLSPFRYCQSFVNMSPKTPECTVAIWGHGGTLHYVGNRSCGLRNLYFWRKAFPIQYIFTKDLSWTTLPIAVTFLDIIYQLQSHFNHDTVYQSQWHFMTLFTNHSDISWH